MTVKYHNYFLSLVLSGSFILSCGQKKQSRSFESEGGKIRLEVVADSIRVPFGMCFLPDNKMLVTNRFLGELLLLDSRTGEKEQVRGVPTSYCRGDGGALDIVLHPEFEKNRLIYFAHSVGDSLSSTLAIDRAQLKGSQLQKVERIFTAYPNYKSPSHYGCRMLIKDRHIYFTMGDRYDLKDSAQTLGNHLGKVMRIALDGSIPEDNPFVGQPGAKPEIWSYGHRNPQGMTLHPTTNELWLHEHGPKGGDELNLIKPAQNYGWPVICYGIDYDDTPIGEGITHKEGMEQPIYHYTPSIAPSGMQFYTGDRFPDWKGNLFIGAMAGMHLNRLILEDGKVVHEERLLKDLGRRIRIVRQGPDGYLYLGVDGGMVLRVIPF